MYCHRQIHSQQFPIMYSSHNCSINSIWLMNNIRTTQINSLAHHLLPINKIPSLICYLCIKMVKRNYIDNCKSLVGDNIKCTILKVTSFVLASIIGNGKINWWLKTGNHNPYVYAIIIHTSILQLQKDWKVITCPATSCC